jgi:hypothetical protein
MHSASEKDVFIPPISLPPVRGLVPLHNRAGQFFALPDIHRAIRYQCRAFNVLKLDLLAESTPPAGMVESCLAFAREFQVQLSLRTQGAFPPDLLAAWRQQGLFDVCLAGDSTAWLQACKDAAIPVRVQLPLPVYPPKEEPKLWVASGVRLVTFLGSGDGDAWRTALEASGMAVSIHKSDADAAYLQDHQQYQREAHEYGTAMSGLSLRGLRSKLIFDNLRLSGIDTPSDRWLVHFLRVFTPLFRPVQSLARVASHLAKSLPPSAAAPAAIDVAAHPQYFDAIDLPRLNAAKVLDELASEARAWEMRQPPSQVFESDTWGFDNVFHDPMPGVNQVHALLPGEKRGSKLPYLRLPFMVSVTVGGGMAEYSGFAMGRHIRVACPMVATAHQLTLYTDAAGRYVLLRDGRPTIPVTLAGHGYTPPRLPDAAHLQVAVWSPEPQLSITALRVWEGAQQESRAQQSFDASVVVFSTRFSRRLQAALECVAHQAGNIQVIVGLVPGIDAAEDVLDSLRRVYPALQIEAVTLPADCAHSKGFAINACLDRVRAPLTLLIDSDILLPLGFIEAAIAASSQHGFIAPAGRAMLDADATARILLGKANPWENFDALAAAAPETRTEENPQGVPLGYCQVFRSNALATLRYAEYDHFQGADYEFGDALMKHFGGAHRLGKPVLHLHHDTRQWFGAQKQY